MNIQEAFELANTFERDCKLSRENAEKAIAIIENKSTTVEISDLRLIFLTKDDKAEIMKEVVNLRTSLERRLNIQMWVIIAASLISPIFLFLTIKIFHDLYGK